MLGRLAGAGRDQWLWCCYFLHAGFQLATGRTNTHSPIVHTDCDLLTSSGGCGKLLAICPLSGLQQLPG